MRSGDRFIFVYNTASRASFEEFKFTRERLMTTLLDRELRKGMTDQLHMGWYGVSSLGNISVLNSAFDVPPGGSR